MQLCRESLIIQFIMRVLAAVMAAWKKSRLCGLFERVAGAVSRSWEASGLRRLILREGRLNKSWQGSLFQRLISWLLNIIPRLLHKLYSRFQSVFEGSMLLRALFYTGTSIPLLISWFFLMLLVVPQDYWNNWYSLIAIALIFLLFIAGAMRKRSQRFDLVSVGPYPVFFAVLTAVFVVLSVDRGSSLRFFSFHLTAMLAVLLMLSSVETKEQLKRIVIFAAVGILIASVYGLYQRSLGIEVDEMLVDTTRNMDTPGRIYSFFENSNSFAAILVMVIPMTLAMGIYGHGKLRVFSLVTCLFGTLNLLLTYSRGSWIGFAAAIFVFVLLLRPRLLPLLVLLVLAVLPILPQSIFNRLLSIFNSSDTSISSRSYLYSATWLLIRQNPVIASGLGSEVVADAVDRHELYKATALYIHSHNIYLQIAAETGVFGLLAFLGAMLTGLKRGIGAVTAKNTDKELRGITAGAVASLAGMLVYSFADYPWSYPRVMVVFWLLFGILLTAVKLKSEVADA